ncbi:MAG: ATP-dependent Clp protease proteolytic subunit [Parvularculaceae bacterium]|nr:ATP-dependent Clp protease proteolytic subunit [Parvularculaceae bacterium]
MSPEIKNRLAFSLTIALFIALGFFAFRSGRAIYATGPAMEVLEERGAVVFVWDKPVEAPMAFRFREAFDAARGTTDRIIIDLHSPGGALIEGRSVIEEIERMKRTHRVDTRVNAGATCASMCVPIFLAGQNRVAAADARFMFHEPTSVDFFTEEESKKPAFEQRRDAERFFDRYFTASPMDAAWREELRLAWIGRDIWKSGAELVAEGSGVVTAVE